MPRKRNLPKLTQEQTIAAVERMVKAVNRVNAYQFRLPPEVLSGVTCCQVEAYRALHRARHADYSGEEE